MAIDNKERDFIVKLEAIFAEILCLNEDIKAIKADAKDAGYKPAKLSKIAKLRAEAKTSQFVEEQKEIIKAIEDNNL